MSSTPKERDILVTKDETQTKNAGAEDGSPELDLGNPCVTLTLEEMDELYLQIGRLSERESLEVYEIILAHMPESDKGRFNPSQLMSNTKVVSTVSP